MCSMNEFNDEMLKQDIFRYIEEYYGYYPNLVHTDQIVDRYQRAMKSARFGIILNILHDIKDGVYDE